MNSGRSVTIALVCSLIGAPIGAIIGIYISTAIYHGISRLFGSSGTFDRLFFCLAAIQAPETVLGMAVYLFYPAFFSAIASSNIAAVGIPLLCFSGFGLLIGLYSLVLFVLAVAGAENLTTGRAIATVLLPTILIIVLIACISVVLAGAIGRQYQ